MPIHDAPAGRYKEVAVRTANPVQLIVMLYDGAIHNLKEAQEHMHRKDIPARARALNRAVAIVSELQACLNFREGGSIAGSLDRLYSYMKQQIFRANMEISVDLLSEVIGLLENLRSAWREVADQATTDSSPALRTPVFESAEPGASPAGLNIRG